jgi:multidrug efflux pump subunit AcrA (membrane-fusion protein)
MKGSVMKFFIIFFFSLYIFLQFSIVFSTESDNHTDHSDCSHVSDISRKEAGSSEHIHLAFDINKSSIQSLYNLKCEHATAAVDCSECRFELGICSVKGDDLNKLVKTGYSSVVSGDVSLRGYGKILRDPLKVFKLTSVSPGRVEKLFFQAGDQVKKGDPLALIHSSGLARAKSEALKASREMKIFSAQLEKQEKIFSGLDHILKKKENPSDVVKFLKADSRQLSGPWHSRIMTAAAKLLRAQKEVNRYSKLLKSASSAITDYEKAEEEYLISLGEFHGLLQEIKLNVHLDLDQARVNLEKAGADLKAAEHALCSYGINLLSPGDKCKSVNFEKNFDLSALYTLEAPVSGSVISLSAAARQSLDEYETVMQIADTSEVLVYAEFPLDTLSNVIDQLNLYKSNYPDFKGLKAQFYTSVYKNRVFSGFAEAVLEDLSATDQAYIMRCRINNRDNLLKSGMHVNAQLILPTANTHRAVNKSAILNDNDRKFIFQHLKDDLWIRRDVITGADLENGMTEILSPLPENTKIIISGGFILKSDILREKMGAGCAH